jgi:hypothetical protein
MAQTTLPVRLFPQPHATASQSVASKFLGLVIALVTCSILAACGPDDGDGIRLNANRGGDVPAAPTASASAAASLAWDPVGEVVGYYIHYGTESPESPGSCAYAQASFSPTPAATVTGLAANTTYYFAVSSFNGVESACSAEVSTVTDSV